MFSDGLSLLHFRANIVVRQAVRSLEKAKPGLECVRLDYFEPATIPPAMLGARGLLLMAPPLDSDAVSKFNPVIACASARASSISS